MDWTAPIDGEQVDDRELAALRERLAEVGYDEGAVAAALGLPASFGMSNSRRLLAVERLRGEPGPVPVLTRLFCLADNVETRAVETALGRPGLDTMQRLGVLHDGGTEPGHVYASASLTPLRGRLFLADQRWERPALPVGDGGPATPPQMDTDILLRITPRAFVQRLLDIGTGSGPHALVAAAHSGAVLGIDIAARPLAYACLNARLNAIGNSRFRQADITRSDADVGGEYDLILSNPPFVAGLQKEILFRDGGPFGDDVLCAAIRRLPGLLVSGGHARFVTQLTFRHGETVEEKLARALAPEGNIEEFDIVVVTARAHDLDEYALTHATRIQDGQTVWTAAEADRLRHHFEDAGIQIIVPALIAFRHVRDSGRLLHRTAHDLMLLDTADLDRIFDLWDLGRGRDPWAVLGPRRYRVAASVRLVQAQSFDPMLPDTFQLQFEPPRPWAGIPVSAELARALRLGDGSFVGTELCAAVAAAEEMDEDHVRWFLCGALGELLLHAVLETDL